MKSTMRSFISLIMAVVMFACLLPLNQLSVQADDTEDLFDAASYDPGARQQVDIENESTWHILKDRPISDLIHDDYVVQFRNSLVERSEEITLTLSRLDDYMSIVDYLYEEAVAQTDSAREGDYLWWQTSGLPYEVEDHVYTGYQIFDFHPEYYTDADQETAVDNAVTHLIDSLGIRYKTDYVKVKAVYEWMTGNIDLVEDTEDGSLSQTAYGALIERKADSKGFSLLFYRLMMELGMDTRIIHGITPDFDSWFWNIIKLGDVYYYVDAALGVNYGNPDEWFLNGAAEFIGHTANDMYRTLQFSVEYESAKTSFEPGPEDLTEENVCQGAFLEQRSIRIDENETVKLNARVIPSSYYQGVIWSSSDPGIVSVDQNGIVTGVREGTAYISAKAESGGKTARMKVIVEKVYPDSGTAYAIKVATDEETNWGDLIFVRSKNNYETDTYGEIVDLWGKRYKGIILAKGATIEDSRCVDNGTPRPWMDYDFTFMRIYVAENQIIHPQILNSWFYYFSNLEEFYGGGFDMSCNASAGQLFGDCKKLKKVDFTGMYTGGKQSFPAWFSGCSSLEEVDFRPLGEVAVTSLWYTFNLCTRLQKLDFSNLDTSSILNMKRAFFGCKNLEEIKLGPSFTKWIDETYLPAGNWTNGTITLNETELYEQYPEHASEWAGTWKKVKNLIPVTELRLNRNAMQLRVGESETLSVEIIPADAANRNVTWASSDSSVARVDENGKVTARKAGTAVITVKSQDSGVTDTCTVTVTSETIRVTAVMLPVSPISLTVLESTTLVPEIIPLNATDRSVTWSSSDSSIVSVNGDGVIVGRKEGTAVVTVKTNDGNYTDSCAVMVNKSGISLNNLTLNKHSLTLATKSSERLSAIIGTSVSNNVIWSSSDEKVATVDNKGNVTAKTYGTAAITAVSASEKNVKDACLVNTRYYDVNDSSKYYYSHVYWAADGGITKGYDGGVYFGPQRNCTRCELSIFLWRMMGRPAVSGTLPFSDMKDYRTSSDSYKAILWCYQKGIVKGYSSGNFLPDASITRKDTMIMLYRLAGKPNVTGTMKFKDVIAKGYAKTSDTYRSIIWGTEKGITNGYNDGTFKPDANCLREHIVTFIHRYDLKYN